MALLLYTFGTLVILFLINRFTFWIGVKNELDLLFPKMVRLLRERVDHCAFHMKKEEHERLLDNLTGLSLLECETIINRYVLHLINSFKNSESVDPKRLELIESFSQLESDYLDFRGTLTLLISTIEGSPLFKFRFLHSLKSWMLHQFETEVIYD